MKLFIHLAQGGSVLTAPGLPVVKLSKRMAHELLGAPAYVNLKQAVRFAQVKAVGGDDNLAYWIMHSPLVDNHFANDAFWLEFMAFFARPAMFDNSRVSDMVRYLRRQKFDCHWLRNGQIAPPPQPNFSLKGRTAASLLRLTDEWLRDVEMVNTARSEKMIWQACAVPGAKLVHETPNYELEVYEIQELLSSQALLEEGRAMQHCVFSYAKACMLNQTAIFSLKMHRNQGQSRRLATIEVSLGIKREIVQVRAKHNAPISEEHRAIVRHWAHENALRLKAWVFYSSFPGKFIQFSGELVIPSL